MSRTKATQLDRIEAMLTALTGEAMERELKQAQHSAAAGHDNTYGADDVHAKINAALEQREAAIRKKWGRATKGAAR